MTTFICRTCGVQHSPSDEPPARCAICEDERQYVGRRGQQWVTLEELREDGHRNTLREIEPGLVEVHTEPRFAIGQRALLVRTPNGNALWDCVSHLDDETVDAVSALGGVGAIACSHPHFYASMVEWGHAFGAEVFVPEADAQWLMRPDEVVRYWSGSHEVLPGVTIVQTGGHFEGSTVMRWADGAGGKGALLTGDTISVVSDPQWVTFMRSYPNYIPLPADAVRGVVSSVRPLEFDRLYGGWPGDDIPEGAKESVERSADRYLRWIGSE